MNRILTGLVLGLLTSTAALAQETVELIFNAHQPPHTIGQRISVYDFAERIAAESGGTIKVTIPGSSLAPSARQLDMVVEGVADMATIASDSLRQSVVLTRLGELPFSSITATSASTALWEAYKAHFEQFDEFKGVKVLGLYVLPGRNIMTIKNPVSSMADLSGLKVWASAGEQSQAVEALGATAIHSEYSELFEYTSKGTIDAMLMSPGSANGARVGEYLHNMTVFQGGLGSLAFAVFISQERWDSLSSEHQDAILRAAEGLSQRTGEALDAGEASAMQNFASMDVQNASAEFLAEVHARVDHQVDDWLETAKAAGLDNAEDVLTEYRARMYELSMAQ